MKYIDFKNKMHNIKAFFKLKLLYLMNKKTYIFPFHSLSTCKLTDMSEIGFVDIAVGRF